MNTNPAIPSSTASYITDASSRVGDYLSGWGHDISKVTNDVLNRLHQAPSKTNSVSKQEKQKINNLLKTLGDFGGVVKHFSIFEVLMSGLGMITTGFDADWTAYFGESIAEFAENSFIEGKGILEPLKAPLKFVADINGIRNKQGKLLKKDELMDYQDQIIGGLNRATSVASIANTGIQLIKNSVCSKKEDKEQNKTNSLLKTFVAFMGQGALPSLNAMFMWISAVGKKFIAHNLLGMQLNEEEQTKAIGAMTSGNQDWLCGLNSALLMVRQGIEHLVSPTLGKILEPVFALYIAVNSFIEGNKAVQGMEDDEDANGKFALSWTDKVFGKQLYSLAQEISSAFKVELPSF